MHNEDYILSKGELKAPTYSILAFAKTTNSVRIFVKCHVEDEKKYFSGYIKNDFEKSENIDLFNDQKTQALWHELNNEYRQLEN